MTAASDTTAGVPIVPVLPPTSVTIYGKKVLIVMPWQKQVSPITAFGVAQLVDRRRTACALHYGDAFVAHSRNSCADLFLESSCEWMLSIDDDMIVPFGNAEWFEANTRFGFSKPFMSFNALDRLMSHKKTVVGALYFGRHPGGPPVYGEGANVEEAKWARKGPYDLAKPTRWVGTGCLLTHRSVFEDIEKRFPALARNGKKGGQWYTSTEASLFDQINKLRNEFQGQRLNGEHAAQMVDRLEAIVRTAKFENPLGVGEDVSFCLRANAAGHKPHVDLGLVCGHIGTCVYGPHNTGIE